MPNCQNCPQGYVWSPYNSDTCYRVEYGPYIQPTLSYVSTSSFSPNVYYNALPTLFYADGYNINGTGNVIHSSTTDYVWFNNSVNHLPVTSSDGPMNRQSVWTNQNIPVGYYLGGDACLPSDVEQTVYLGVVSHGNFRVLLNGIEILNTSLPNGNAGNWGRWNVYPIKLPKLSLGANLLTVYGDYIFGYEVYQNTFDQLTGATSLNDLNIIASSYRNFGGGLRPYFENVRDANFNVVPTLSNSSLPGFIPSNCTDGAVKFIFCAAGQDVPTTPTPTPTLSNCVSNGKFTYTSLNGGYVTYLNCCGDLKTLRNIPNTFDISECFQLDSVRGYAPRNSDPGDLIVLAKGNPCTTNCVTQTPTPTSTKSPTPTKTPTTTPTETVGCRASVSFTVDFETQITWTDCCGNINTRNFTVGNHTISGIGVIQNSLQFGYLTVSNISYQGYSNCCATSSVSPTSTKTPTPTPTLTQTRVVRQLQCCCSSGEPLIIQPSNPGVIFNPGEVWVDNNKYCWLVLPNSNNVVNSTYNSWGGFSYFGNNNTSSGTTCQSCCRETNGDCPPRLTSTPTKTPTNTPTKTVATGLTPTATASKTPTKTPTVTKTPTKTSAPSTICVTYCNVTDGVNGSGFTCDVYSTTTVTLNSIGLYNGRPYYQFINNSGYIYFNSSYNQWVYQQYFNPTTGGYGDLYSFAGSGSTPNVFDYSFIQNTLYGFVPLSSISGVCPTPTPTPTPLSTLCFSYFDVAGEFVFDYGTRLNVTVTSSGFYNGFPYYILPTTYGNTYVFRGVFWIWGPELGNITLAYDYSTDVLNPTLSQSTNWAYGYIGPVTEGICPEPTPTIPCNCVDTVGFTITGGQQVTITYEDCCGNLKGPFSYTRPRSRDGINYIYDCIKLGSVIATSGSISISDNVDFDYCCGQFCPTSTPTPSVTMTNTPTKTKTPTVTPTKTTTIGLTPTATASNTPTPSVTKTQTSSVTPTPTSTLSDCYPQPSGGTICLVGRNFGDYEFSAIDTNYINVGPDTYFTLSPIGMYNNKVYYRIRFTSSTTIFIFWSITDNRWEFRTSGIGQLDPNGTLGWYLNLDSLEPVSSSTNPWIANNNRPYIFAKLSTSSGTCIPPTPSATPTQTRTFQGCVPTTYIRIGSVGGSVTYKDCCENNKVLSGLQPNTTILLDECIKAGTVISQTATVINVTYSGSCTPNNCPSVTPTKTPTNTPTNPKKFCVQSAQFTVFRRGFVSYTTCCGTYGSNTNTTVTQLFETGTTILNTQCIVQDSIKSVNNYVDGVLIGSVIGNISYDTNSICAPCVSQTPTPTPTTTSQTVTQSLTGLKIEVMYFNPSEWESNSTELISLGYVPVQIPNTNVDDGLFYGIVEHKCVAAYFYVYTNGIKVLDANINNGSCPSPGLCNPLCVDDMNTPPIGSGWSLSRYTSVILSPEQATAIAQTISSGNTITVNMVCARALVPNINCGDVYGSSCHNESSWIRISKSDGTVIFNGGIDTVQNLNINLI